MPLAKLHDGRVEEVEIDLSPLNPPVANVTAAIDKANDLLKNSNAYLSATSDKPQTLEEVVRRLICVTAAFADNPTFHSKIRELAADAVPVLAMARARKEGA